MKKHLLSLTIALLSLTGLTAQQLYVDEDFDAGSLPTGWTNSAISGTGNWKFGYNGAQLEAPIVNHVNNIDSTNFAYFDDDDLGANSKSNRPVLTTPSFDNSLAGTTTLKFNYNYRDEGNTKDTLYVDVYDGSNWINVFSAYGADDCGKYSGAACAAQFPSGPKATIDISAYANANCQVRFIYWDGGSASGQGFGYYTGIDNVHVSAPVDDDISVEQIIDPLAVACGLDSAHQPIIKLVNEGTARATNFDITFDVGNGAQSITETVTDTIAGGDSLYFQFTGTVNLSSTTPYQVLVYSTWSSDGIQTNDTIRQTIRNEPSFSAPYFDGFESQMSDWKAGGKNSSWDRGFPSGPTISFANQGNEAWVTNLFGEYNNLEESYLTSPCFDFSAALGDPNVAFDLYRHCEGFDSLVLQTSVDNGATWQTVPKTVIERNWYNDKKTTNGKDVWSWHGKATNWVRAENILTGLAGEGQVKLRFKFKSDQANGLYSGGPFDGFAIDAFRLGFPKAVDLGIQRMFYPDPGYTPDCGYSLENLSLRLENKGATEIDTFLVSFQVDNKPIRRDSVFQSFPINTIMTYNSISKADFTGNPAGVYRLNVWITALGDGNSSNDSLKNILISNTTPQLFSSPYVENFDANLFSPGSLPANSNSTINSNWVRSTGATWHVANSTANLAPNCGPASDHTGNNGNFIYTETTGGATDDVVSIVGPCLDFSTKDSLTMEFWYFGYGGPYGTGLHLDIFDGSEWDDDVQVISQFNQVSSASDWTLASVNLDKYAGKRIKFRFRFVIPSGTFSRSVIAIDDIVVYEPISQDAEMISINGPVSDCALGANSLVNVTVKNFGIDVIPADSLTLVYQIIASPDTFVVREQLGLDLLQRATLNYTFNTTANLSLLGKEYKINAWTELGGDSNFGNDSVSDYLVTNFTRPPGYIENFSTFDFLDGDCLAPSLDQIGRGWTVSNTQYTWNVQDARICRGPNGATPTFGTGPEGDHTTALGDGRFFYTESTLGSQNDQAGLISPCIDFRGRTGAALAFWYHKFGSSMGDLYIDVLSDGIWTNGVDTVIGETQTGILDNWEIKAVKLGQFSDKLIQIRFRGVKKNAADKGDMAIDDLEFYEPIRQDARVSRVTSPVTECSPSGQVTVVVENFGYDPILPNTVQVFYSVDGSGAIGDTLPVGIPVGGSVSFDFTVQGVFNKTNTTYNLKSWTALANDSNAFNDSVGYTFTNITQAIQYVENFESFTDGGCIAGAGDILTRGWRADPPSGGNFHWNVQNAGACGGTGNGTTGPRTDATRGGGNFMYATSTQGGSIADLYLPCIDFTRYASAGMTFKYHMFGSQIGTLQVQVYNDVTAQWDTVYSISGQQQTSKFDPWREASAKFEEFGGQEVEIRFRAIKSGARGEIALDDIGFYLPQPIDARLNAVIAPVAGCEIYEQSIVGVEIENFGTKSIFSDSLDIYYQVDNRTPVKETYFNQNNALEDSLKVDEVATFYFATVTDLSELRKTYNIKAWTSAKGEGNVNNDTLFTYSVTNQTKRTNYFENFETFKDAQCAAALGQVTANGWTTNVTGYTWHVQSSHCRGEKATFTQGTGPEGDHTTGDGTFLYVDGGDNGAPVESPLSGTAIFESPCIDLQPNTNVHMTFWFHRFGPDLGNLAVDVFANGVWNNFEDISVNGVSDTALIGEYQTKSTDDWQQAIVDLSAYAGDRVLVRFRAVSKVNGNFRGDIAIDDILIFEPSNIDIGVTEIIDPNVDLCQVGTYSVKVRLENFGLQSIASGDVVLTYSNGTSTSTDTVNQLINAGDNIVFTFTDPIDLTLRSGVQDLRVTAKLVGDTISENNSIRVELNNRQPSLPRYFMDFENHSLGDMQGWRNSPAAGYSWSVMCGAAPSIDGMAPNPPVPADPTGPSGDHTFATTLQNGDGCYMWLNSNQVPIPLTQPDALLELPCGEIDFSNSVNNKILMTFWYHMFGANMGDLYIDVHDGTAWRNRIDVIRDEQQFDDTDRWKRKQVQLSQFAGLDKVKIRFRAEYDTRSGDMGIDDVEILDRAPHDANMVKIIDPESDCEMRNTEILKVQYQNTGTEDILESILCYELTFTPYKGVPEVKPMVCDTIVGTQGFVAPLAFQTISFKDRVDMSEPGTYTFKIWTNIVGDTYDFNDTIVETVVHETRPFPNCEDFSDIVLGQIPKLYRDGKMPNAWVGTTAAYAFKSSIEGAGPVVGHTGGNNDAFLLLDDADGMQGQVASIESACYDLTNTPAAILEFWVQAPSENHFMLIEARNTGGQWTVMDTLRPQGGAGGIYQWTKITIVMTEFVGGFAQVKFTGVNAGDGFYAIDDFCMIAPPKQQIEFERFVTPGQGLCFYSDSEMVTLRLQNIGLDRITKFRVVLAVDSAFQNFPVGKYFRDTIEVNITSNPFFEPGDKIDLRIAVDSFLINMSARGQYYFSAYILLPGDRDLSNNLVEDYEVFHPVPIKLPFVEDFEFIRGEGARGSYTNGLQQLVGGTGFYRWTTNVGAWPDAAVTGPLTDHTKGKPDAGVYMITDARSAQVSPLTPNPQRTGDIAVLQTRCIDLSTAINPEMKYWYYLFGFQMGSMDVYINDDSGWKKIDSLPGEDTDQKFGPHLPWKSRTISLLPYAGKFVKLRFWSNRGPGHATSTAIDDISVYDLAAKDLSPYSLAEPTGDTNSCYSEQQQIRVNLRNNGSDSINFIDDSTFIQVIVFKRTNGVFTQIDSMAQWIDENLWKDANGIARPLPTDSLGEILMDSTFDMTDTGKLYKFVVDIRTKGDVITRNDQYTVNVLSQWVGGEVVRATPNDTICYGDQVTLHLRNHFGGVRWEEKLSTRSGVDEWYTGLNFPYDSAYYYSIPDSTTKYRARICGTGVVSDSMEVVVIKPFVPEGIDASRCDSGFMSLRAKVRPNITNVRMWDSLRGGTMIVDRDVPFGYSRFYPKTDTFYLQSIIRTNKVRQGFCASITRDSVFATINYLPNPILVDTNLVPECDPSISGQGVCRTGLNKISVCQDSSYVLDGGRVQGRQDNYEWTIIYPNGNIINSTNASPDSARLLQNQTLVIDAWQLEVNKVYAYTVIVTSDSGCVNKMPYDTVYVTLSDSCITSLEKISFKESFDIYPNPVGEELFIKHQSSENFKGSIRLMSVEGQLIKEAKDLGFGNLNYKINMGQLPKGIYIIKVETENGSFVEKIIKS